MNRITFAGNILNDVIKIIPAWPDKGMLVPITSLSRAVGGSVCNTSIDLKTLDPALDVRALGKVGDDDAGEFATAFMKNKGVDVSRIVRVAGVPTSFTDVMTIAATGERTFFNMHGADSSLSPEDVDAASLDCDIFHLGYLLLLDSLDAPDEKFGTQAARLLAHLQASGIKTSVDIVSEKSDRFEKIVRPALRYCDYVIINEFEAANATGLPATDSRGRVTTATMRAMAEALISLGVRKRAVIHSPELSASIDRDGNFTAVPSLDLPAEWIKGSVGAGDAFCAGTLYAIMKDMDADSGLRLASCAAACNLAAYDSVSGAKPLTETIALETRFKRKSQG